MAGAIYSIPPGSASGPPRPNIPPRGAAARAIKRTRVSSEAPAKESMTASQTQGIWFVYRSHGEAPLAKRVRRVAAPSVIAWFQAKIEEARISLTPHRVAEADLGGPVRGLAALFEAARQQSLHTPKSTAGLGKLLQEHLHADEVRVDAHAVRVLTSDEDGESAWFFFDDEAQAKLPRNLAWLIHEAADLPEGDADRPFAVAPLPALAPAGEGEGATYACLYTLHGRPAVAGRAFAIPGVRLPDLAGWLRRTTPAPAADGQEGWPVELSLLRALVDPADTTIGPALSRAAAYPLDAVLARASHAPLGAGPIDEARAEAAKAAEGLSLPEGRAAPVVHETAHAAIMAAQVSDRLGYQQWILFDDRWGAAHPELSTSILHATEHADPFAPLRPAKAPAAKPAPKPKADKGEKTAKPKADKAEKAARAKAEKAASRDEQAWKAAVGDRDAAGATLYRPAVRFDAGALIAHPKFGLGVTTRVEGNKVEVMFKDGPKLLVHGM